MTDRSRAEILLNFLHRRGLASLSLIVEHLNNGTAQTRIARQIQMDPGQLSRFIRATLKNTWVVAPEIQDMVELYTQMERRHADRVKSHTYSLGERPQRIA